MSKEPESNLRRLARSFAIELIIYGVLLTAYFLLVLQFLGAPLTNLFDSNLVVYSVVALTLIVVQAVVLEAVTSFLIRILGLEHFD